MDCTNVSLVVKDDGVFYEIWCRVNVDHQVSFCTLAFSEFDVVIILNVFCECFLYTYAW
jgi:hypothetical protein